MPSSYRVLSQLGEEVREIQTSLLAGTSTDVFPRSEEKLGGGTESTVKLHDTNISPAPGDYPAQDTPIKFGAAVVCDPAWVPKCDRAGGLVRLRHCPTFIMRAIGFIGNTTIFLFITCVLILFTRFFVTERLFSFAVLQPQLHWLTHSSSLPQLLSSIIVITGGWILLPHLRRILEMCVLSWKEHARFLAAAESSLDDFYIFDGIPDTSGRIVDFRFNYINPNAERRLKTRRESLRGKILTEVRPFMITSGLIEKYREVVRTGVPITVEVFIDDERIKATWLKVQVVKLGNGIAITSRDITESKRLSDHVNYLAYHDQLTRLANRTLLQDRLQQAILRAQRHKQKVAVFMLDIDNFKHINDSLGHADGDALLRAIGERLRSCARETDTVARIGGDEFVIVMPDFKTLEDVERCGKHIVESTARPITLSSREVKITVSVGLCIYPDGGLDAEQLLKNADAAMYLVKDRGRNGLHLFAEEMIKERIATYGIME